MLLIHVTKDNRCAFCDAGVIKCAEITCQNFFNPAHSRHIYCLPKCKMKHFRRLKTKGNINSN